MIRVFCDFDGTVASEDVGNALFSEFAGPASAAIVRQYIDGAINARECLQRECEAAGIIDPHALGRFVDQFELDPGFARLAAFCDRLGIPVTILSDGLDFYVERILKRHGLGHLRYFANHVEFVRENGGVRMIPSFPWRDEHCDQCGNCKRNHIVTLSGDEDRIVYVGDGISDRCPVRYADVVFAKRTLIRYCQEQNISYFEFNDFDDVQQRLEQILKQKHVKARREAVIARRDVFIAE